MAVFIKTKRVSDPFNDIIKARLLGSSSSSGSEHEADPSCFSGLVHAFLELDEPDSSETAPEAESEDDGSDYQLSADAAEMVKDLLNSSAKLDIQNYVMEAAEAVAELRSSGAGYRRAVMGRLRENGYNAGICKARWESSGGLTAGSYEYIDIMFDDDGRYIVDLDFAAQFEIARATEEYEKLLAALPVVMTARAEDLRRVVRIMAEAAKRCLKKRELSVPPWRKRRYVMAKWLGPHRRSVNPRGWRHGGWGRGRQVPTNGRVWVGEVGSSGSGDSDMI